MSPYRFAAETDGAPIRSVLLGIETPAFFGLSGSYPAVAANAALARFLPEWQAPAQQDGSLSLLLSPAQADDAFASLRHALGCRGRGDAPWRTLEPDGFQSRTSHDEAREASRWSLERAVRAQLKSGYLDCRDVDEVAFRDYELLLGTLRGRGVRILVLMTPALEAAREYRRRCDWAQREEAATGRIRSLALAYGARFVDFG